MVLTSQQGAVTKSITLHSVDQLPDTIPQLMIRLTSEQHIPQIRQMQLLTRLRLARNFPNPSQRRKCVLARLQAISILGKYCVSGVWLSVTVGGVWLATVYSVGPAEIVDPLIYDGLVEELVEVLEIKASHIMVSIYREWRGGGGRAGFAICVGDQGSSAAYPHCHYPFGERPQVCSTPAQCLVPYCGGVCRLASIIEATGAATYHGFLPSLVRDCVAVFTGTNIPPTVDEAEFPLTFATALFSFLYHLATYEASESSKG